MSKRSNKPPQPDLGDKLKRIADQIADQLLVTSGPDGLALEQKVLAFKELKSFYAMLKKLPDGDGGSFGGFAKSIADIGHRGRANGTPIGVEPGTVPEDREPEF